MNIDLELYYVFYVTAKEGNISRAAAKLFISQPAVSYSIKKLEESLGSPVFIRKSRGVELTEAARPLYDQVAAACEMLMAAQEAFMRSSHAQELEIRMSFTEIFTYFFPISYLREFQASHPKIRVCLSNHGTSKAVSMLREGSLDLAVVTLPALDMDSLEIHCAFPMHDCFVVNERFRHLAEEEISLRELAKYPVLVLRPGLNTRRFFDQFTGSLGIYVRPQMELENIEALIRCARMGYGASFVVREMVEEELAAGELYLVRLKETIPPRAVGLCSRKPLENKSIQQFAEGFVNFVEKGLSREN